MRNQHSWTDEELRKTLRGSGLMAGSQECLRRFLTTLGAVHPHEAREREREAFEKGFGQGIITAHGGMTMECSRDRLYPSLLPKEPPPLVLSTGTWTRQKSGYWLWDAMPRCSGYSVVQTATASDARKLAEWLAEYGNKEERK